MTHSGSAPRCVHRAPGDACDVCSLDMFDDWDGDAVCFSDDQCPGYPDSADSDLDGVPDGCDEVDNTCPDTDGDGTNVRVVDVVGGMRSAALTLYPTLSRVVLVVRPV